MSNSLPVSFSLLLLLVTFGCASPPAEEDALLLAAAQAACHEEDSSFLAFGAVTATDDTRDIVVHYIVAPGSRCTRAKEPEQREERHLNPLTTIPNQVVVCADYEMCRTHILPLPSVRR